MCVCMRVFTHGSVQRTLLSTIEDAHKPMWTSALGPMWIASWGRCGPVSLAQCGRVSWVDVDEGLCDDQAKIGTRGRLRHGTAKRFGKARSQQTWLSVQCYKRSLPLVSLEMPPHAMPYHMVSQPDMPPTYVGLHDYVHTCANAKPHTCGCTHMRTCAPAQT